MTNQQRPPIVSPPDGDYIDWAIAWRDYAIGLEKDLAAERARVERLRDTIKAVWNNALADGTKLASDSLAAMEAALAEPPSEVGG